MGQEHSILLAIMIFLIFQNSPKQENSLYQQFSESVGLIGFGQISIYKIYPLLGLHVIKDCNLGWDDNWVLTIVTSSY